MERLEEEVRAAIGRPTWMGYRFSPVMLGGVTAEHRGFQGFVASWWSERLSAYVESWNGPLYYEKGGVRCVLSPEQATAEVDYAISQVRRA